MKPLYLSLSEALQGGGVEVCAVPLPLLHEAAHELRRLCRMEEGLLAAVATWEASSCETVRREDVLRVMQSVLTAGTPQPV